MHAQLGHSELFKYGTHSSYSNPPSHTPPLWLLSSDGVEWWRNNSKCFWHLWGEELLTHMVL